MANTYSALYYHLVFSTKNRQRFIKQAIEARVWAYMAGVARANNFTPIQIGGLDEHVHVLIAAKPVVPPSEIVKIPKVGTSKWIHEEMGLSSFGWQDGYGAFSVSKSNIPSVIEYIKNQRSRHERESFGDEYEKLMRLHEVDYDPKYLLD